MYLDDAALRELASGPLMERIREVSVPAAKKHNKVPP